MERKRERSQWKELEHEEEIGGKSEREMLK
jgi:hypothetical protein